MRARPARSAAHVVLIGGDGIGPEVVEAAAQCLEQAARLAGREVRFTRAAGGGEAIDRGLGPMPDATIQACLHSDGVLLGAVGGPRWDRLPGALRPEAGLLELRRALGAFANIRPVRLFEGLEDATPLRPEVARGTDLVIVRELLGGLYYGARGRRDQDGRILAFDTMEYADVEIDRVARFAFELARKRRRKLCLVDKANILETSRLWRERVESLAGEYPDVECTYQYVDSCAMKLVQSPRSLDVLLCENTFGDILSDEAAVLAGSLGMLASASIGGPVGLYEPVHGTAPDIAGLGLANPIGAILSAALLARLDLQWDDVAAMIEEAVAATLQEGFRTRDLVAGRAAEGAGGGAGAPAVRVVGTREMTAHILERLPLFASRTGDDACRTTPGDGGRDHGIPGTGGRR
ncbi:MAG: 3-isopropylmalate dehydrogenase [Limnochordaceae bacterium]|nr:3-isopropylmalate dehydrogenase [Limnochordaceae bacterium]